MQKIPRKFALALAFTAILVLALLPGCSSGGYAPNPVARKETLTQISTVNALLAGVYDGTLTCKDLKGYGDFGVGTFEAVDGEMVVLDGKIYQVKSDGVAYAAADSTFVPFAAVTYFNNDGETNLDSGLDFAGLQKALDRVIPVNTFCAVKISGKFSYMKTRSVPKQPKPYPPLAQVTAKQSVFEFRDIAGTIVGFRCPPFVSGVNVPGYHLHFLTADRKAGGHILELSTSSDTASLDFTPEFLMLLPDGKSDFYKVDFSGNQEQELQKVEK
jgi:acetolactate decarboxylase